MTGKYQDLKIGDIVSFLFPGRMYPYEGVTFVKEEGISGYFDDYRLNRHHILNISFAIKNGIDFFIHNR